MYPLDAGCFSWAGVLIAASIGAFRCSFADRKYCDSFEMHYRRNGALCAKKYVGLGVCIAMDICRTFYWLHSVRGCYCHCFRSVPENVALCAFSHRRWNTYGNGRDRCLVVLIAVRFKAIPPLASVNNQQW